MPYSAWPTQLKMPLDLDGSVMLQNQAGFTSTYTIVPAADLTQLQGESPAKDANTVLAASGAANIFVTVLFPELRDLTGIIVREAGTGTRTISSISSSTDTTNGLDGSWSTVTPSGTSCIASDGVEWWRSNAPATVTGATTGIKALRFIIAAPDGNHPVRGVHLFGAKTSGQTADDIQFLNSDGTTVSTSDLDFGDIAAGGVTSDQTIYVKNSSGTKTANTIALSFTGSNPGDFTMSIDGGSNFFATRTITSLASAATQQVIIRATTPSVTGGNATPRAANIRATVGSWT